MAGTGEAHTEATLRRGDPGRPVVRVRASRAGVPAESDLAGRDAEATGRQATDGGAGGGEAGCIALAVRPGEPVALSHGQQPDVLRPGSPAQGDTPDLDLLPAVAGHFVSRDRPRRDGHTGQISDRSLLIRRAPDWCRSGLGTRHAHVVPSVSRHPPPVTKGPAWWCRCGARPRT